MSDDLLDNDGLIPDTKFLTFLKVENLYFYIVVNLIYFTFCLNYIITDSNFETGIYLLCIYMLNNIWLFLTYLRWRNKQIGNKNSKS